MATTPETIPTNGTAEIFESTTTQSPTTTPIATTATPTTTTQTNGISEIAEANTLTSVVATTPATPTATTIQVKTNEIAEIAEANTPVPPVAITPVAPTPATQPITFNKTKDNKPHTHTPFDFDAFITTIPPTLVAPNSPPTIISTLTQYIVNVEFCYRFLYFVRNNKNNQMDELKTIAKIIMEYYAPDDTTYFNFELKKIDLTNKTNKNIDDITIYTNKGKQTLEAMLKQVVAQVVPTQQPVAIPVAPIQVGTQVAVAQVINTKIPEPTKIVSETNAFRASQQKAQNKFFESMNIKILTYNINHASQGQSRVNIMSILKEGGYDIIGIQESYDENLQISDEYDKVTSNVNKTGKNNLNFNATIITFYKKKRFEIKDNIYYGNCNNTNANVARPYHIITLLDKITNANIDVINLHNEHEKNKKYNLTNTIKKGYVQPSNNHTTNITRQSPQTHNKFTNNNKNAIVIMGDFNTEYYFKNGILDITGLKKDPPKSCCKDDNYSRGGDYILTSGFKESENTIANNMKDASDHYPVERILTYSPINYDKSNPSIDYHIHYINSLPSNERESIINKIIESKKFTDQDINKLLDECLIESKPSKPSNPQTATGIYHEKQVSALCGIHALNNALQKQVFYKGDATAKNTIAFIDAIQKDKTVKDTERDAELKNQNYLASTIVEAIKLVANNKEFYEMTPSLIQATYDENEILQSTIQNGPVENEVLLTGVGNGNINLRDFRIVFNKRKFHYTSAFFKGKQWIYLDSMNKDPITYDTFNKLVMGTFKIHPNSDVDLYISNLPWMCAFIPDSKYDGTTATKTKGGRVRHCQKTIKNRKSKSKSKSKGITIKMH